VICDKPQEQQRSLEANPAKSGSINAALPGLRYRIPVTK